MRDEPFYINLVMRGPAEVDLSERGEQSANGIWSTIPLLMQLDAVGDFRVDLSFDEEQSQPVDRICVSIYASHMENPETGRTFHANVERRLNMDEAKRLRDWLIYAIEQWHQYTIPDA